MWNNFNAPEEQNLFEGQVIEIIQIYGDNVYYLPRRRNNFDPIYGADDISSFDTQYVIEMYLKNVDGFEGDGSFYSKMNFVQDDSVTWTISRRRFDEDIGQIEAFPTPRQGDLIYWPVNNRIFEITYVETKPNFLQFGKSFTFDLVTKNYQYSGERFTTGIAEIDSIQKNLSTNILDYALVTENGDPLVDENGNYIVTDKYNEDLFDPLADDNDIQHDADDILDFSEHDPFSEGGIY